MTQEEKAKSYDEALERAKSWYIDAQIDFKKSLETLFPELKVSEDEKIMKELIDFIKGQEKVSSIETSVYQSWIAWIEKHGERKSLDDIAKEVIKDKDAAISFLKSTGIMNENGELADEYKVKQGEQKLIEQDTEIRDLWEYIREFRDKFGRLPKDEDELAACINYVIKRQKPAECNNSSLKDKLLELFQRFRWYCKDEIPTNGDIIEYVDAHIQEIIDTIQNKPWSEEDKEKLDRTISLIHCYTGTVQEENELKTFLESLKNRVQPKQEWSDEDETVLSNLIYALANDRIGNNRDEYVDWLKSLKDRYTWKPSNEQMKALEHFVRSIGESGYTSPYDNNTKLVYSLLSELKKLREE